MKNTLHTLEILKPLSADKNCFCFALNDNYSMHLDVALRSLAKVASCNRFYDIIVLDNGISDDNKKTICSSVINRENFSIRFIKTDDYIKTKFPGFKQKQNISYYLRFLILDYFRMFNEVLYLDCDLIIVKDPYAVFSSDIRGKYAAVVRDSAMCSWININNRFGNLLNMYFKNVMEGDNPMNYFNSGVILFNIKENIAAGMTSDKLFREVSKKNWRWQDQDIFNHLYHGKVAYLDFAYNLLARRDRKKCSHLIEKNLPDNLYNEFRQAHANPIIIHYASSFHPTQCKKTFYNKIYWEIAKTSPYYNKIVKDCRYSLKLSFFRFLFPPNSKIGGLIRCKLKKNRCLVEIIYEKEI